MIRSARVIPTTRSQWRGIMESEDLELLRALGRVGRKLRRYTEIHETSLDPDELNQLLREAAELISETSGKQSDPVQVIAGELARLTEEVAIRTARTAH